MTVRSNAVKAAVIKAMEDAVAAAKKQSHADLKGDLTPGARVYAVLPGREDTDETIGTVSYSKNSKQTIVTDEAALFAWVKANHPTEVYTPPAPTERIREAFLAKLKDSGGMVNGELVPGMETGIKPGSISVTQTKEQRDYVAEAWNNGELTDVVNLDYTTRKQLGG